eukprot:1033950-Pyramimonas_sp.AAC.1
MTTFAESVDEARECNCQSAGLPANFFNAVFPAYLEAMTTCADYYFSDIELLALARCKRQNVVIFVHCSATRELTCARSRVGDPSLPVVATSLRDDGGQ